MSTKYEFDELISGGNDFFFRNLQAHNVLLFLVHVKQNKFSFSREFLFIICVPEYFLTNITNLMESHELKKVRYRVRLHSKHLLLCMHHSPYKFALSMYTRSSILDLKSLYIYDLMIFHGFFNLDLECDLYG